MWTYRNESASKSMDQNPHFTFSTNPSAHPSSKSSPSENAFPPNFHSPVTAVGKASPSQRTIRPKKQFGTFVLGASLYLTGILLGAAWRPAIKGWLWEYAQYYVNLQIKIGRASCRERV